MVDLVEYHPPQQTFSRNLLHVKAGVEVPNPDILCPVALFPDVRDAQAPFLNRPCPFFAEDLRIDHGDRGYAGRFLDRSRIDNDDAVKLPDLIRRQSDPVRFAHCLNHIGGEDGNLLRGFPHRTGFLPEDGLAVNVDGEDGHNAVQG